MKLISRILLGLFLLGAGIAHHVIPAEFTAQVPRWLPLDTTFVIISSGIVEIVLGLAIVFIPARHRATVGLVIASFFVAIFPGNISQYVHQIDAFGLNSDRARFLRLFFQPVLVAWALWTSGAWTTWFSANKTKPGRSQTN